MDALDRLAEPLPTVASLAGLPTVASATPAPVPPPATAGIDSPQPTWTEMPPHAWPLSRPAKFLYLGEDNGMGLAVQLKDGSWLNTAFAKKMVNSMWTTQSIISLAVTAVILSICAAFIARGMTRPMRRLAVAAEALGRGESVTPAAESGRTTSARPPVAFNLMQARLQRFVEDRTRMLAAIGHDLRTPSPRCRLRTEFVTDDETREKMLSTLDELRRHDRGDARLLARSGDRGGDPQRQSHRFGREPVRRPRRARL